MADIDLQKLWKLIRALLEAASYALPMPSSADEKAYEVLLASYHEYLRQNELELALDALEELGHLVPCPPGFWNDLERAAGAMELDDKLPALRRKIEEAAIQEALKRHWDASDASDFDVEHEIYRDDAVLEYPQSGERIRGRRNIQQSRTVQPNKKRFTVRRMIGRGDLWITEFVLTYDGVPSYVVSIMEFRDGLATHETQYFAGPFAPASSRAHLVERTDKTSSS